MRLTNRSIGAAGRGLVQGEVQLASFQSGYPLFSDGLKHHQILGHFSGQSSRLRQATPDLPSFDYRDSQLGPAVELLRLK